jgi:hypothetical protein
MTHKFKVGETVFLRSAASRNAPSGAYEVTKQLPGTGGEREYRIKSANEPHERVVRESELTSA